MAKMTPKMMKAYTKYEKTEPAGTKKKELKVGESKSQKAKEMKAGMNMMKKAAPMKKMGKKK
jgi:hypothetical protein